MDTPTNRILWWSLMASLLVYVVVAHVASPAAEPDAPILVIAIALSVVAFGTGLATLLVRRIALAGPIARGELDPGTPEGQTRAFTIFILNLALSESIGIYGLVLAFLSGEAAWSIPFAAAALVLIVVHRPMAADLRSARTGDGIGRRPEPIA